LPTSSKINLTGSLFPIIAFFQYWLLQEDQYSQQSPFIFSIYHKLIDFLSQSKYGDEQIESIRKNFLKDSSKIKVLDLGAGSKKVNESEREIRKITRYSTSPSKFGQIYQYFCSLTPAEQVIELGTCMGISTRYLAKATKGTLFTMEGSAEIVNAALKFPFPNSVRIIQGPIEKNLPQLLIDLPKIDFALIDATHTYEGTLIYFNLLIEKTQAKSIIAVADIHWSKGMNKAWKEIKNDPRVKLTFDFYECGIVFLEYPGEKSHLTLSI